MQGTFTTPPSHLTTPLWRIGKDPSRFMTVREWWYEMDEPVELLADQAATFAEDTREMIRLCLANGVSYRPSTAAQPAMFPVWLFLSAYPANP